MFVSFLYLTHYGLPLLRLLSHRIGKTLEAKLRRGGVTYEIVERGLDKLWVIIEHSYTCIALAAQQTSYPSRVVIVINMWSIYLIFAERIMAYGAGIVLFDLHLIIVFW